jgi:RNA polymerase sigma-70 factor (ECF subfamily)
MPPDAEAALPDAELARRIAAGGAGARTAFAELLARHAARLLARLRTLFPEDAEDVAQEAWLRAFRWLSSPQTVTNFRAWLFMVAEHIGRDLQRKKHPVPLGGHEPSDPAATPLADLLDAERRSALAACLELLPNDQRAVIVALTAGESPAALAGRLGVPAATVYTRKHRALAALKTCVEKRRL